MKYILLTLSFLLLAATMVWFGYIYPCYYAIQLTDNVVWKRSFFDENISELMDIATGETIVEPGKIGLWGRYPYIVGYVLDDKIFTYNIEHGILQLDREKAFKQIFEIAVKDQCPWKFVSIENVVKNNISFDSEKLKFLRDELRKP